MKVQCQGCGAAQERDGLDAVPGGFGFECVECGEVNVLAPMAQPPAEAPPAEAPEPEVPPGHVQCPKCGNVQRDPEACHRCGLMFSRAREGTARFESDPLAGHPAAETIRGRWRALARDLDDEEGHRAFIQMCAESNLLEYAGACYRRLQGAAGDEDPRVAKYRQRVIQAALVRVGSLEQRATDQVNHRLRRLLVLAVAALIVLGFAVGYYLLVRYQGTWQAHG